MSEAWRDGYDSWKLATPDDPELDEDGEPVDRDFLDAQAEAVAEERAERAREDAMFDREEEW